MSAAQPVTLVTGAMGCIGAWVLHHLVKQGREAVAFDLSDDHRRLDLLLSPEEQRRITFARGDITDPEQVVKVFQEYGITQVVHLAALQVPFCRSNPILGAQVNVVGTVNIFEAARLASIRHLAYASSVAVYGPPAAEQAGQILREAPLQPATLYGVTKVANEGTARVYWQEHGISSTALRPYTVYGVGRDQGVTSGPTQAMLAAAARKTYHIPFDGPCQYHYAPDVAAWFLQVAQQPTGGARVFNLGGQAVTSREIAAMIQAACPGAQITCADGPLPFPAGFDGEDFRAAFPQAPFTPLDAGVRETVEHFRRLVHEGLIQAQSP